MDKRPYDLAINPQHCFIKVDVSLLNWRSRRQVNSPSEAHLTCGRDFLHGYEKNTSLLHTICCSQDFKGFVCMEPLGFDPKTLQNCSLCHYKTHNSWVFSWVNNTVIKMNSNLIISHTKPHVFRIVTCATVSAIIDMEEEPLNILLLLKIFVILSLGLNLYCFPFKLPPIMKCNILFYWFNLPTYKFLQLLPQFNSFM